MSLLSRFHGFLLILFISFQPVKAEESAKKSLVIFPIASLFLPGLDQWLEGEFMAAALYSSIGAGAYYYSQTQEAVISNKLKEDESPLFSNDEGIRTYAISNQLRFTAGCFSSYHSFQTAVESWKGAGEFKFLKSPDTPQSLLIAPFNYSFLSRWTTIVPFFLGATFTSTFYLLRQMAPDNFRPFTTSDLFFSTAFSFNAATGEEALFRGYLMPLFQHYFDNSFVSITLSASLFAAAHLGDIEIPWFQFVMGIYEGWVTKRNGWSISESIFHHFWWDFFIFTSVYLISEEKELSKEMVFYYPISFKF